MPSKPKHSPTKPSIEKATAMKQKLEPPGFMASMRKLHADMTVLFTDDKYHDLKVVCRDVEFHLHRAILFNRCDFFRACFESGFQEGDLGVVVLDDDHPDALRMALFEIYTRDPATVRLHFTTNNTADLDIIIQTWKLADKYQFNDLALQCLAFISSDHGLDLLKKRSNGNWTKDLILGLIETKGLKTDGSDVDYNNEMREVIKKLLLDSKNFDDLTMGELMLLRGDGEVATELFAFAMKQMTNEKDSDGHDNNDPAAVVEDKQ